MHLHSQPSMISSGSPPDHDSHHILHRMQSQESLYTHHQNGMYTPSTLNGSIHSNTDYHLDGDPHKQAPSKLTTVPPSSFKVPFSSYGGNNRQRPHLPPSILNSSNSFRDSSASYLPSTSDLYSGQLTSPTQAPPSFDPRSSFDFSGQGAANAGGHKSTFGLQDPHAHSNVMTAHKLPHHAPQPAQLNGYSGAFVNSLHISSQTPFGPHIPTGPSSSAAGVANSMVASGGTLMMNSLGAPPAPQQQQEDISTIFVVGFPDDMQEREFQNMFTFSGGFEAATLKIPNKEYTSYGTGSGTSSGIRSAPTSGYPPGFNGPNDPYSVASGGDAWPTNTLEDNSAQFLGGSGAGLNMPPRKQIIGFAKFRTREDAVNARDQLQGRRVDIEKGAVLKAEMAKKNLHTKRGVGPVTGGLASSGSVGPTVGTSINGLGANEIFALEARERDFRSPYQVSDMSNVQHSLRRDPREEEERKDAALAAMGLGPVHRGARGREEDDRERRRLDSEMARMRPNNAAAYDAFYSVPQGMSRQTSNNAMLLPNEETAMQSSNTFQIPSFASQTMPANEEVGPWDAIGRTEMSSGISIGDSSSRRSSSPTDHPVSQSVPFGGPRSFSPSHRSFDGRGSNSRSSSVNGDSQSGNSSGNVATDDDLSRAVSGLAVSTNRGNTSPQLPSPSSGASSGSSTRNGVDQNPPINTLYVGNLPISPLPVVYPPDALEENLRELFQQQPGFRRLSFKQKNTGPMCFVEFEDVPFAAKAMTELYGHTLNGLVKAGGIRLSYSKNPLGVRTPTSATVPGTQLQQQQQTQQMSSFQMPPPLPYPSLGEERQNFGTRELSPPPGSIGYHGSSPPPRFFSPPSSAMHFGASAGANAHLPRGDYAYTLSSPHSMGGSSFSPFGLTPTMHSSIPDQTHPDQRDNHPHHFAPRALSPTTPNIEPTRAS